MFFKNLKCLVCRQTLKDFVFDFEGARVICPKCQSTLEPGLIINNSTVNYVAALIPSDVREHFLSKLGFEKKPVVRTPKLVLWFLIVIIILLTGAGVLINFPSFPIMVGIVLFCGLVIWQILRYYKEEKIPKWRKKKST